MQRVRDECGDVGEFTLADKQVVLLSGAEANEIFFRAKDEELDQAAAYPFMTPIFGEGVVFDAPPERRREMLHNQALRDSFMRATPRPSSVRWTKWSSAGATPARSTCSTGLPSSPSTPRRHASSVAGSAKTSTVGLPSCTTTLSREPMRWPTSMPTPTFPASGPGTRPRIALVELVQGIMDGRTTGSAAGGDDSDLLGRADVDLERRGRSPVTADTITGMFISMMFRRSPHHLRHGGLDPDRAAAPSR
jgi:sterol 14-demethylase